MKQRGFTLIELMMVVSIVSILVAIAIPQYQEYSVRSKMSEAIAQFGAAKSSVAEYYQSQGSMPMTGAQAGINEDIGSKYVNSIVYTRTSATVATLVGKMTTLGGVVANNDTVLLEGNATYSHVGWDCKPGTIPTRYLPGECRQ
jgi:type IV pilus assembly protein PilA